MARYSLSPEAKEDLSEIRGFLASQGGNRIAKYVLQEIRAAFRLLASHPDAGHLRKDLTPLPVKFWPVFSYLMYTILRLAPLRSCACFTPDGTLKPFLARRPEGNERTCEHA